MPIVRFRTVARQNDPFPKLTAGEVIERPVHLVWQICARYMATQVLSTQDVALCPRMFARRKNVSKTSDHWSSRRNSCLHRLFRIDFSGMFSSSPERIVEAFLSDDPSGVYQSGSGSPT